MTSQTRPDERLGGPAGGERFDDRRSAGRALGDRLKGLALPSPVVLGLTRGGVPVAYEVAQALRAPLDVLVARKIGAPGNPEYGIGAVAEGDVRVLDRAAIRSLMIDVHELEAAIARAQGELRGHVERYRGDQPPLDVAGRTVIVVDDGVATGGTARAALRSVRARGPRRLVLAVPVGAPDTLRGLRAEADEVVCLLEPELLWAVGLWYRDFAPVHDAEVIGMLRGDPADPPARPGISAREVRVPAAEIAGDLLLPRAARGLIVFAHGSGSSRFSPRNRQVSRALVDRGFATLLLDLLHREEEGDRGNVFDVDLLCDRLVRATEWAEAAPGLTGLPIGYFGASTGAAAALAAAAQLGGRVGAVVSRGGRADLAAHHLPRVSAPVLLIVGGRDEIVLELNREAIAHMSAPAQLAVVEGATHLFEEPGALEEVARLAGDWFERHLGGIAPGGT